MPKLYKLTYHVPTGHLEDTKQALFAAGAGKSGNYDQCCWQVLGEGQFRPLADSAPFAGETNQLEVIDEYRVEMVCEDAYVKQAICALKNAHPYETPSIAVWALEDFEE